MLVYFVRKNSFIHLYHQWMFFFLCHILSGHKNTHGPMYKLCFYTMSAEAAAVAYFIFYIYLWFSFSHINFFNNEYFIANDISNILLHNPVVCYFIYNIYLSWIDARIFVISSWSSILLNHGVEKKQNYCKKKYEVRMKCINCTYKNRSRCPILCLWLCCFLYILKLYVYVHKSVWVC